MMMCRKTVFIVILSILLSIPLFVGRNAQAEDAYEPNDTLGEAWHPGYNWVRTWLSSINGLGVQADEDWYRIDVDPGSVRVQVDCRFIHADGDIDIELWDSSEPPVLVGISDYTFDNEFIDVTIPSGGTYYIRVYCSDAGNTYDLRWDDLTEDAYEENDTLETAWHPGYNWERTYLANINGFGIQADDDWYRIDVDPGAERVLVDCQFTHADGDINIALYNSTGSLLAESTSVTDDEFIDVTISSGDTYYIKVSYGNAGNMYDLWWDDLNEDEYEENDTLETAWHPGYKWVRTWLSSFNGFGIQADEDWYRIDVDPGAERVLVDCQFTHAEGDIDIALHDSTGSLLTESTSVNDDEFIDHAVSSGGTYYIKVHYGNAGNIYDLWWNDLNEDEYEENDTLGTAWHPGYKWVRTWLSSINSFGIQADEDWYRIDVDPGAEQIVVDCQFTHSDGDINIALYNYTGSLLAESTSVNDDEFIDHAVSSGGTYYIKVHYGNARNIYDLWWDDFSTSSNSLVSGIGSYPSSGGWMEAFAKDYTHAGWLRVSWGAYNSGNGETRVATGDIDGDGRDEVVIGLGSVDGNPSIPGGWFEVLDDNYSHLAWGRINWSIYKSANGETWPACGDVDGDGADEIIVGLGSGGKGWFEVFDYNVGSVTHAAWVQVNWLAYNTADGETRPACGDIDGDDRDEVIIGLGSAGGGWFEVFDDTLTGYAHLAWPRVQWGSYNSANGESWPTCGDVDGDGVDEIIVGLGSGGRGWFEVFDYDAGSMNHTAWAQVNWWVYNTIDGQTRPSCGDIDEDGRDEIAIGLGSAAGGWFEVFDDASAGYAHLAWPRVQWSNYNSANGETWPAVKK